MTLYQHILEQSRIQFNDLRLEELHRFIRIQFAGEQGIDAGGLEREWFQLGNALYTLFTAALACFSDYEWIVSTKVTKELLEPKTGLFSSSAGDATGGTYHINPLSSLLNENHLV